MTDLTPPRGPLVSPRVAADLTGIPRADLDNLIRRGDIRTERIKGNLFVDLDDADRAAAKASREGGEQ